MVDMYKQVADATAFVRGDGSKLHSLKALEMALMTMQESEFSHHVNSSKNDFANWVGAVFGNRDLANKLHRSSSRVDMLAVLDEAGRRTSSLPPAVVSAQKSISQLSSSVSVSNTPKARTTTGQFAAQSQQYPSSSATSSLSAASSTTATQTARQSRPLHHKLKGIFKKGEKPADILLAQQAAQQQMRAQLQKQQQMQQQMQSSYPANSAQQSAGSSGYSHPHHTIHAQIDHLDRELAHLTRHHMHTTAHENVGSASLEESVKERILDFALGLIVGLMLGFILAKSLGL